jgi:hypothetical protein
MRRVRFGLSFLVRFREGAARVEELRQWFLKEGGDPSHVYWAAGDGQGAGKIADSA